MTQIVILNKLAEFLKQTNSSKNEELCASLKAGHCNGFSICFGAMVVVNKLTWWSEALRSIAAWDETPAKLKEKIFLYGSIDDNAPTLANIFERVLNYIIYCHIDNVASEFRTDKISILNILNPSDNHFELLGADGNVKKIKKLESFAGYFTTDHLFHLLDERLCTDSLCIIDSTYHTVCIAYKDRQWIIYDPNYPHDSLSSPIYKSMPTKSALIDEIIRIQGHSLAIRVAVFKNEINQTSSNYFNSLIQNDAETLIKDFGLHQMARYAPEKLLVLINRLGHTEQGLELIVKGLTVIPPIVWTGILNQNIYQTGLREIISYAPQHLSRVFELAAKSQNGLEKVIKLITATDIQGWSDLRFIAQYKPQHYLSMVFGLVSQSKNGPSLISETLAAKSSDGWTTFHVVLLYFPEQLVPMLELIEQSERGRDLVVESLVIASRDGSTVLQTLKKYAPQHLSKLHEFAAKSKKCPDEIALCILTDAIQNNNYDLASLLLINANSLELRNKLIQKIVVNENIINLATILNGELENKRAFAVEIIKRLIKEATTSLAIRQLIFDLQINNQDSNYIFARRGILTTYSLYGHCWNGHKVSGSWVGIINFAKQRILDLFKKNNFENIHDDDLQFLQMKTMQESFFIFEIDYYKKYLTMRESYLQSFSVPMRSTVDGLLRNQNTFN